MTKNKAEQDQGREIKARHQPIAISNLKTVTIYDVHKYNETAAAKTIADKSLLHNKWC